MAGNGLSRTAGRARSRQTRQNGTERVDGVIDVRVRIGIVQAQPDRGLRLAAGKSHRQEHRGGFHGTASAGGSGARLDLLKIEGEEKGLGGAARELEVEGVWEAPIRIAVADDPRLEGEEAGGESIPEPQHRGPPLDQSSGDELEGQSQAAGARDVLRSRSKTPLLSASREGRGETDPLAAPEDPDAARAVDLVTGRRHQVDREASGEEGLASK